MTKATKKDLLIYKALNKAIDNDALRIYLDYSRINRPTSPVYDPWECLLPILVPLLIGLFFIVTIHPFFGLIVMVGGIFAYTSYFRKKLHKNLVDRTKELITKSYRSLEDLWAFGGIVFVNNDNKKVGCVSPDGDWKDFVVRNFSEYMVEKKKEPEKPEEPKQEKQGRHVAARG